MDTFLFDKVRFDQNLLSVSIRLLFAVNSDRATPENFRKVKIQVSLMCCGHPVKSLSARECLTQPWCALYTFVEPAFPTKSP